MGPGEYGIAALSFLGGGSELLVGKGTHSSDSTAKSGNLQNFWGWFHGCKNNHAYDPADTSRHGRFSLELGPSHKKVKRNMPQCRAFSGFW